MKEGTRIVVALGAAVVGGVAIAASGSSTALNAADAIAPIGTLWVNAIRMTVIPLIVSLLVTGIASTADVASIGRLGGRTLLVFGLLLACVAAVVVPLAPSLFALLPFPSGSGAHPALPAGAAEAASQLAGAQGQTFARWLTSLIPPNPIAAAANGDMVPLIVFSILLALAILRIPAGVARAPRGVLQVALRGDARARALGRGAGADRRLRARPPVDGAPRRECRRRDRLVHRGVLGRVRGRDALVVSRGGDRRASSASTLRASRAAGAVDRVQLELVDRVAAGVGRERRAGSRDSEPNRRIRRCRSPCRCSRSPAPVSWTVGALFVGWFYGIPLHAQQLATIAFAAVFLAFAAPGIPRGAFIMLAPLFLAIGLPVEGIGILIAVDALPDTFATVLNVTGDLVAATLVNRFSPPLESAS